MRYSGKRVKPLGARRREGSRVARIVKRAALAVLFFTLGAGAGLVIVFYSFSLDLPAIGPLLEGYDPPQTTRFTAADGTVIGEIFVERRTVVPIEEIPEVMVNAVIAAEDADFREHEGLDYPGMFRAIYTNLTSGKLAQGASTITQQVARTFFLSREKTFARKIKEILLTKQIEERLTKDEILYLYLNQINFGRARYGVGEAARYYFDKEIRDVTIAEAALLAGIPKGPAIYEPIGHRDAAKRRRAYVLGEMAKNGFITESQADLAASAPLGLSGKGRRDLGVAPEAVSLALEELEGVVDIEALRHGGYVIETGIDLELQRLAREELEKGLVEIDRRHKRIAPFRRKKWLPGDRGDKGRLRVGKVYIAEVVGHDDAEGVVEMSLGGRPAVLRMSAVERYNPDGLSASGFAVTGAKMRVAVARIPEGGAIILEPRMGPQGAVVAIEPQTGRIAALVGGDRVGPGGFDRASMAARQPGSAFKPLVYLEAIRTRRYTPASMVDDSPEVDGDWKPENSRPGEYAGPVPMRQALARSLNLPAIKLIRDVGPDNVVRLARRMGIESELEPGPALALGSSSVTPLEMAGAYAVVAAGGERHKPWVVRRVVAPGGKEIPLTGRIPTMVLQPQEAYVITSMLASVVSEGTGRRAAALKRPVAGKTGTSNGQRDAWFVGFTPQLSTAVWIGYDEPRSIGRKEYGGKAALPIWVSFMERALEGEDKEGFDRPEGIVEAVVDPASGLLAYEGQEDGVNEIFIEGTEPMEAALPPDLVSLDGFLREQGAGLYDAGMVEGGPPDGGPK